MSKPAKRTHSRHPGVNPWTLPANLCRPGSRTKYTCTYDSLGQVTSGRKYWANGTPVAGQQFDYSFDSIGNRQTAASGGNQFGTSLRQQNYTANTLNQYTSRTVPPYFDVLGTATNNARVTVWADKALPILTNDPAGFVRTLRQGEYWRAEVPLNNSTGALWLTLTNYAVLQQGTNADILSAVTGSVLVAKSPEAFTYDTDGNLTSDSLWTNTWNGENRRVTVESGTGILPVARMREQWTFLPDGRWIERIVSTNNASAYVAAYTNRYVWDGNVLLAVLDHTNSLSLSFTRGLDLNGTPQGAGGAGGLLFVGYRTSAISYHAAAYDGNGNVTALVNLSDGTTSAEYAYGPFAEPLQSTGPMAKANPLRYSTQYADDVTGDVDYLFRSYTPRTARWLNRDPIVENGGMNLYGFVQNSPGDSRDRLGLFDDAQSDSDNAEVKRTRTCKWSMYFGHLMPSLKDFAQRRKHIADGDRFGYMCCSHYIVNQLIPESARLPIPLASACDHCDKGSDRNITDKEWNALKDLLNSLGIPLPDRSTLGYCLWDYDADLKLVRDLAEAMKGECGGNNSCCKKIKLTISCHDDALEAYVLAVADWDVDKKDMIRPNPETTPAKYAQWKATSFQRLQKKYGGKMFCGKTVTIDCRDLKMKGDLLSLITHTDVPQP